MANLNFKALQRQKSFMFLNKMDSYCKYMEMLSKYPGLAREEKTAIFSVMTNANTLLSCIYFLRYYVLTLAVFRPGQKTIH